MSTVIKPEVSHRNAHYISKHRYYELKHYCMQYNEWKKIYNDLCNYIPNEHKISSDARPIRNTVNVRRLKYLEKISKLEDSAKRASPELWLYILKGVTENRPYNNMKLVYDVPCSRDEYYELYRKFFYILDRCRDA